MANGDFTLDTQDEEKLILSEGDNPGGRIILMLKGDFDSGDVEIGYKDESDVFTVFTGGTSSAKDDYELATGIQDVFAKATGVAPDVKGKVSRAF